MNARAHILGRIRDALSDVPGGETAGDVSVPREYRRTSAGDGAAHVARFAERVEDYRATVHRVDAHMVADAIGQRLQARGVDRVAIPAGFPQTWRPDGVELVPDDGALSADDLDGLDGVLSASAVGIAETGTIVLDGGGAQGRRMLTLVPDYHLCVVEEQRIVGSVPEAIAALEPTRPMTWISGPSATSDIELDRVEGVHGPRTLDVLIVASASERPEDAAHVPDRG